jgi:hypothetical protein
MEELSISSEPPSTNLATKLKSELAELIEYPGSRPDWYDWKMAAETE